MNRYFTAFLGTVLGLLALGNVGFAQTPPPFGPPLGAENQFRLAQAPSATSPQTTIKLHVVLSKYQGDKKISSQPYDLSLLPGQRGNLRIGSEVPVYTGGAPPGGGGSIAYSMQNVGTQIDATVTATSDGKYVLDLTLTDRSINNSSQVATSAERVPNVPIFRNVSANSKVSLSNGESAQFSTALDQVTNETFKVDVTLNVGNK